MSIHSLQLSDGRRVNLAHVTHTAKAIPGFTNAQIYLALTLEGHMSKRERADDVTYKPTQISLSVSNEDFALVNAALDTFAVKMPATIPAPEQKREKE